MYYMPPELFRQVMRNRPTIDCVTRNANALGDRNFRSVPICNPLLDRVY